MKAELISTSHWENYLETFKTPLQNFREIILLNNEFHCKLISRKIFCKSKNIAFPHCALIPDLCGIFVKSLISI